jgi:hypothetical protein
MNVDEIAAPFSDPETTTVYSYTCSLSAVKTLTVLVTESNVMNEPPPLLTVIEQVLVPS